LAIELGDCRLDVALADSLDESSIAQFNRHSAIQSAIGNSIDTQQSSIEGRTRQSALANRQ
jgi:hypothetical protein